MNSDSSHAREDGLELNISGRAFSVHKTLLGAPYSNALSLEATNYCNLACSHCGHSQFPGFSKGHFDMKYFQRVEHLLGAGIKGISLSNFGEPFMSKAWNDLLHRSLSLDSPGIFFITNGLLLDRHIEEILNPRISMAISIDGASEKTYGFFRGRNNFSKLTSNLALLKEIKAARGIPYPEVTFLFTVSRINCDDLPRIVDMAEAFGASSIIVQLQVFYDLERFKRESLFFARDDYDNNIAAARKRASALGINLLHPSSFDGRFIVPPEIVPNSWLSYDAEGKIQCHSQSAACYLRYNGVIEACCTPDHNIMGSLDFNSFEDIWHGPNYRDLRLTLDRGIWPDRCRYCSLIQVIDVHDERAHFTKVPAAGFDKKPEPLRYRITELDRIYREALSFLPHDHERASLTLSRVLGIDENLYEVQNLKACLDGLRGDFHSMREGFERAVSTAPRDSIIKDNFSRCSASCLASDIPMESESPSGSFSSPVQAGHASEISPAIRMYKEGDEYGITSLFKEVFKREMPLAEWKWKYRGQGGDKLYVFILEDAKSGIVGNYGGISLRMILDGREIKGLASCDTMIHPGHRNFVKFKKMALLWEDTAIKDGHIFFYGFPGDRHFKLAFEKVKIYERVGAAYGYSRQTKFNNNLGRYIYKFFPLDYDDERIDRLWELSKHQYKLAVIRDRKYLQWRYRDNQLNKYEFWGLRKRWSGELLALAVLKKEEGQKISVMDLVFLDNMLPPLLQKIENYSNAAGYETLALWLPHHYDRVLKEYGFTTFDTGATIPTSTRPETLKGPEVLEKLYYTMGDTDYL